MVILGFSKKNPTLVMSGGIIGSICLFWWCRKNVEGWPDHWSILLIMLALAVVLTFCVNRQPITGLLGFTLLLSGIFAYPGIKALPIIGPIGLVLNTYWPIIFIVTGLIFLFRK